MADRKKLEDAAFLAMQPHLKKQTESARRGANTKFRIAKVSLVFSVAMLLVATSVLTSSLHQGSHPNLIGYIFIAVSVAALVASWRDYLSKKQAAVRFNEPAA